MICNRTGSARAACLATLLSRAICSVLSRAICSVFIASRLTEVLVVVRTGRDEHVTRAPFCCPREPQLNCDPAPDIVFRRERDRSVGVSGRMHRVDVGRHRPRVVRP